MPDRDSTLDDFVDGGSDEASEATAETGASEVPEQSAESEDSTGEGSTDSTGEGSDDANPVTPSGSESVDPAEATYRWTGEGARCDGCGSHVERLWRDDAGLVCGECKEW